MKLFLPVFLCVVLAHIAAAQSPFVADHDDALRYGITGAADINMHSANFQALPGVPSCCPRYATGSGIGLPSFGVYAEKPLSKMFALDLRASYLVSSAVLSADEQTDFTIAGILTPGTFRHTVDAQLSSVGLEPLLVSHLFGGLALEVGARAALALTKTYSQKEEIITPATSGVFTENGLRTRNVFTGTIPGAESFGVWLIGGLSYDVPMNAAHTLLLAPEVMYLYAMTPVASGLSWKANTIRAGVSIKYAPAQPEPVREITPPPPVVPAPPLQDTSLARNDVDKNGRKITHDGDQSQFRDAMRTAQLNPKPALSATLAASGVEADGSESPFIALRVEEFISTAMRPLLPYVFFDENSATISERYKKVSGSERGAFQIDRLFAMETMPVYYHVLNIIGRRLSDDARATVTLTGCNDDRTSEKGNRNLSQHRAESVRNFLHDVWGIAEGRMKLVARDLPSTPSNPDSTFGIEENRRVEISSDTWTIMAPVISSDTLRTANPPTLRFRDTIQAEGGETRWTLLASQQSRPLRSFDGTGTTPSIVDWNINDDKESIPRAAVPIETSLEIADSTGQKFTARSAPLLVNQITLRHKRETQVADHTVDKFSLILFDFDKSDISASNKRLCAVIREHIDPTSTVRVDGYSDRSGDSTHNLELSQARAVNVAHLLGSGSAASTGQRNLLFSNETPEGRCYCRTVTVTVETPVKR